MSVTADHQIYTQRSRAFDQQSLSVRLALGPAPTCDCIYPMTSGSKAKFMDEGREPRGRARRYPTTSELAPPCFCEQPAGSISRLSLASLLALQ